MIQEGEERRVKKILKKLRYTVSILLAVIMIINAVPTDIFEYVMEVYAEEVVNTEENLLINGTCGENMIWELSTDGILTISGTGYMDNWLKNDISPWKTIGDNAIKEVIIKDGVTSIGNYAFSNCSNLTKVTIPDSVTFIGDNAFYYCENLTEITIPDSVTIIGSNAFYCCRNLTEIMIPDSVTVIYAAAFMGCNSLTKITISDGVTKIGYMAFAYCSSLTEIMIPNSVTSIGDFVFKNCSNLTKIKISDSITSIGDQTFSNCSNLAQITIPDGVASIGDGAFKGCSRLNEIIISNGVTYFGVKAFEGSGLSDVYYNGGEGDWNNINVQSGNELLLNATIHYNSTGPDELIDPEEPIGPEEPADPEEPAAPEDDLSHVVSFSPANGETNVDLAVNGDFNLDIYFDTDIEIGDGNIYICDYETGEIYRTVKTSDSEDNDVRQGFLVDTENSKHLIINIRNTISQCMDSVFGYNTKEDVSLIPYDTKLYVKMDSNAVTFKENADIFCIDNKNTWVFETEFGLTRDKDMLPFSNDKSNFGSEDYNISEPLFNELINKCYLRSQYDSLLKDLWITGKEDKEWAGSCEGMVNVMTMVHDKSLKLVLWNALKEDSKPICNNVKKPLDSKELLGSFDLINYYQLLQYIPLYPKVGKGFFESRVSFNEKLIEKCKQYLDEKTFLPIRFVMEYYSNSEEKMKKISHVCMVTDMTKEGENVSLELYDPSYPTKDAYMVISPDGKMTFNSQWCADSTNHNFDVKVYGIEYVDVDGLNNLSLDSWILATQNSVVNNTLSAQRVSNFELMEGHTLLKCSGSGNFSISNADGETVYFNEDTGEIEGTMNVYEYNFIGDDNILYYLFEVDNSENFTYTTDDESFSLSVEQNNSYSSVSAEGNVNSLTVYQEGNVSVIGDGDITYRVAFDCSDNITEIISVSGNTNGDMEATYEDGKISLNSNELTNTVMKYYKDTDEEVSAYDDSTNGIEIENPFSHQNSGEESSYGDNSETSIDDTTGNNSQPLESEKETTDDLKKQSIQNAYENIMPSVGTVLTDTATKNTYVVTAKGSTVAYKGTKNKKVKKITIPSTVTINGTTYKVTSIASGAFKNNKKLTKVTVGSNVQSIGKKAFYGCKKLKTIVIKSKKLTAKSVGAKAFTKAGSSDYEKCTVKVPRNKKSAYTKVLKKKGLNAWVKIK